MVIKTKYLSTAEVAKLLGISRVAVLKRITKGNLKAVRIGRNYAIPELEVLGELGEELKEIEKKEIDWAVKRVVREYGGVLEKLGET